MIDLQDGNKAVLHRWCIFDNIKIFNNSSYYTVQDFFPLLSLLSACADCFSKHLILTSVTTQSGINCFFGLR